MADVVLLSEQVRERWLREGLEISTVNLVDIARMEYLFGRRIPSDYRQFLSVAGLPHNEDSEGFRFWSPGEWRATRDVLEDAGYQSFEGDSCSVIFADYLQESWWYAVWLSGAKAGGVSLALGTSDGRDPQRPIGSMADFLEAYLAGDQRLYPKPGLTA
jgi:hypothetical protein